MDINELLRLMVEASASDLIVKSEGKPAARVDGKLQFISEETLPGATIEAFCDELLNDYEAGLFREHGEVDLAYRIEGLGRFRLNVFRRQGLTSIVFRYIKDVIPSFADLGLPAKQMLQIANMQRGLVLLTGVAGSGKSTTLAAVLEYINEHDRRHIITVEDPIEYQYYDKKSVINQREVGSDTENFAAALKHCMRQSPDVILIGEMRDRETMEAALHAAETGHMVFSTLHTINAVQTVERIINFFPAEQHALIRLQLSLNLEAVISQRLLRRKGSTGRIPAVEILLNTPLIGEMLAAGDTRGLAKALSDEHDHYGTQTFNQSLCDLFASGTIDLDEAKLASDNPEDLLLAIRGIQKGGDVKRMPTSRYNRKAVGKSEKESEIVTGTDKFKV